ncbi:redox-regulated ATPase YchF [Candidatus Lucifugimonas marina]|jgi:GTP-binding protein YchF|uniref:Redox-regulated ATPase YchF n=1 Tax=Candidatus Lucifugimonas marina TaxID=3038979 RepID=A0AAJ5ZGS1_9CHLR|nr:redox-regulated ATPase YchF [SAR202 cluster bacterium JH702]WFG35771.1 redox-regulated ATPase YchF [SAR202 cluster bacterium JH545]WFG39716.1 redox-regulated ATPase YchF [SAR202 cluster bacterium JH1073]
MKIGILGLPASGKTTIFNSLTRGKADIGGFGATRSANVGVAHVPDERVDVLTKMFKSKKTIYAEVTYVDLPGSASGELFEGEAMAQLQQVDAILHVARAFEDGSVPHLEGSVDYKRDIEKVAFDIMFADIALLERRIERITGSLKTMKVAERDDAEKNIETLKRLQSDLENGIAIRDRDLEASEIKAISDTFLLSSLPLLIALNIGEDDVANTAALEEEIGELLSGRSTGGAAICGALEAELVGMSEEEEAEMRAGLDAGEPGLSRMIKLSYQVLGLNSFLTVGEDETRAWTINIGALAPKAAGVIHSDIERGFIRAETVGYDDFIECGTMAEARNRGLFRQEGREYVVQDGDIVNFLFSV